MTTSILRALFCGAILSAFTLGSVLKADDAPASTTADGTAPKHHHHHHHCHGGTCQGGTCQGKKADGDASKDSSDSSTDSGN